MTQRRLAWLGVALSVAGIGYFTLRPGGSDVISGWSFYLTSGDAALAELIQNLILFIPLGVSLTLAGVQPRRVVAIGGALSFCVEFAQQYIPGRDPSAGDIFANTVSTALGALLVVGTGLWLWAPPRRSSWQALATAVIAVSAWAFTGIMVQHDHPPLPYHVVYTPSFDFFGQYNGSVVKVTPGIGSLEVTAVAGPYPPGRTSPLFAVLDRDNRKIIMLSVDGTDLALRYYMPALRWTLEQPDLRLRGALAHVAPGDTFSAATWHDSSNVCLRLNKIQQCHLGYTIGDGWKLIYYPEQRPAWMLGVINMLWVAGTVIGVGFWGARGKEGGDGRRLRGAALALVIAGLLMVPLITGLKPTPLHEWVGALGGIALGWWLGLRDGGLFSKPAHRAAGYTAPPSHPRQTS